MNSLLKDLSLTNKLLLFIVVPLVFFLLKILSFILIPLVSSMFIALMYLPLMRRLKRKKVPNLVGVGIVLIIFVLILFTAFLLIKVSSLEIVENKDAFLQQATIKLDAILLSLQENYGIANATDANFLTNLAKNNSSSEGLGNTFGQIGSILTMLLMTVFFTVLLLAESVNVEKLIAKTIIKTRFASVKTFRRIEKDLIKFIKVKVLVSFGTGVFTGMFCYFFDVSFPIFWGLFAFLINFVQMVGSFVTIILVSIFAAIEIEQGSTLFLFVVCVSLTQVLYGSIVEPIFMGKTFSINVVTVLVMLMLWGFIWGIPGMILAIPITAFLKIIFEQLPKTKILSDIMSGD